MAAPNISVTDLPPSEGSRAGSKTRSDDQLIRRYIGNGCEASFETLLRRHYDAVFSRFIRRCRHRADAEDLSQQLWVRVIDNLDNYHGEGKFAAFLNTIATNLINDYWRRCGARANVFAATGTRDNDSLHAADVRTPEDQVIDDEAIAYLACELIPGLPAEQRLIYLLRHESEHWEEKQRLQWRQLAELNGVDVPRAWRLFERARNKLMRAGGDKAQDLSCDETIMFLVWTQAQRPAKDRRYTDEYFAELMGVSVNTLKTRYRAAVRQLSCGLRQWSEGR
ncbi:MAG: RNA polymerase sigma factor [Gammaproteobacteria bacterium]